MTIPRKGGNNNGLRNRNKVRQNRTNAWLLN